MRRRDRASGQGLDHDPAPSSRRASLATKGENADIEFSYGDLTDANFGEASLNTEGYGADIDFRERRTCSGAKFGEASLATEGDERRHRLQLTTT